jgi:Flp pilus assembly pilin Flp
MLKALHKLASDDSAAANTEYVVVLGLIIIAVIAIIAQVGPRVLASWAVVEQRLDGKDGPTVVVTPPTGQH